MNWYPSDDEGQAEYEYQMSAMAEYEAQMEAEAAEAEYQMEMQREKEEQINRVIEEIEDDIRMHEMEISKLQNRIAELQSKL